MIELYSPQDEVELSFLKSILEAEEIIYYVRNEIFGSLKVGPLIELYNKRMILVKDEQYEYAKELLMDYLDKVPQDTQYSLGDKIRMVFEFFLFNWIIPGRKRRRV